MNERPDWKDAGLRASWGWWRAEKSGEERRKGIVDGEVEA